MNIKPNTYYLYDGASKPKHSYSLSKLINLTTNTTDARIYYNNVLVWVQNPERN